MKPLRPLLFLASSATALCAAPDLAPPVPDRLDLPTALRYAAENNFTLRQARERVNQAQGQLLTARAGYLPRAVAQAGYSHVSEQIGFGKSTESWSGTATLQQTLYAGGAVSAGAAAARSSRDAATFELAATTNQVFAAVRTSYYNVLRAGDTIKVREQALALLEEELKNARNRFVAGAGAQFDVLRAEVAAANGRPPLITARNDLRIAIEELRQLLGYTNRDASALAKTPEFLGQLSYGDERFDLAQCLELARRQRPELQALQAGVEGAQAGVKVARAGYLPTVSAAAGWEVVGNPARPHSQSGHSSYDGWTLGLQSQWNLFDGRATAGKVRSAKSQAEQARLALQERELAIDVEVRRAFASWQQAVELVGASAKVVEQATEALRLSRARFDAGAATQLDVLQAQVALTDAGNNQVQSLFAYNVAVAQVRTAIGQPEALLAAP